MRDDRRVVSHRWKNVNLQLTTPRGFEPLRAEPNGFLVDLLNHSDTVSVCGHANSVWACAKVCAHRELPIAQTRPAKPAPKRGATCMFFKFALECFQWASASTTEATAADFKQHLENARDFFENFDSPGRQHRDPCKHHTKPHLILRVSFFLMKIL